MNISRSASKIVFLIVLLIVTSAHAATVPLPSALLPVQKQFFLKSFQSYVAALAAKAPELHIDPASIQAPEFDATLSREGWIGAFSSQIAQAKSLNATDTKQLQATSEDLFLSYYHNVAYARVSYLQTMPSDLLGSADVTSVVPLKLPTTFPKNHTLDIQAYVDERFPVELQSFVQAAKVPVYIENSNAKDVLAYQRAQGFSMAVRFMGDRDTPDSQFFLVYNPETRKYRFAISDIHGDDDQTRISEIIGPAFTGLAAFKVNHALPAALFDFNAQGQALKIAPSDLIIIGFQNTVWWQLLQSSSDWHRDMLTRSGADVALFSNPKISTRVISVANVYGDEMKEAMSTIYARGGRSFVYLGTGGGLDSKLNIGDVMYPNRFETAPGVWISLTNDAEKLNVAIPEPNKLVRGSAQGWVPTLVEETRDHMQSLMSDGVQALDVESRYFADFTSHHEVSEKIAIIVVSDTPLGTTNYNQENLTRSLPIKMINLILPQLMH